MSFDLIAPVYDWLASLVFGDSLTGAQAYAVSQVATGSRVLVLGGGTGRFLPRLLARHPARIIFVEASAAMLRRAQKQWPVPPHNLHFQYGAEADVAATDGFDVIFLPFVLDLYTEAVLSAQVLPTLKRLLANEGTLLVCDFDRPKTRWQQLQLWTMIRFFRLVAGIDIHHLPDWPRLLQQAGFREMTQTMFRHGQVRTGEWRRSVIPAQVPDATRAAS